MKTTLTALFLVVAVATASAQENLQAYTPSILFESGEWEFKTFFNLYTQTQAFDANGGKVNTGRGRETFATSINQFLYGFSDQFNAGFDVWVKGVNLENGEFTSRTAVTGFGPKIKIAPFKKLSRLSLQSTLLFPVADDLEGRSPDADKPFLFLETDKTLWLNQIFYDLPLNDKMQLFFQQAFWYNFVRDSFRENNFLQTQSSVFYSYFPTNRWTVYAMTEFFPTHYNDAEQQAEFVNNYFVQSGIGTKFQLIPNRIELEFLYTNFWLGSEGTGAGQTFNVGLRLVRQ